MSKSKRGELHLFEGERLVGRYVLAALKPEGRGFRMTFMRRPRALPCADWAEIRNAEGELVAAFEPTLTH